MAYQHCGASLAAAILFAVLNAATCFGVTPSEQLLPATTRGWVSIADYDAARAAFNRTQFGQLVKDESMKPFAETLKDQLTKRFNESGREISVTWEDIENVYSGEICLARLQPGGIRWKSLGDSHAIALLVDCKTNLEEAAALIKKIDADLKARKATLVVETVGKFKLHEYKLPRQKGKRFVPQVATAIADGQLILCSDIDSAKGILDRINGAKVDFKQAFDERVAKVGAVNYAPRLRNAGFDLPSTASISPLDLASRIKLDEGDEKGIKKAEKIVVNARRIAALADIPSFQQSINTVASASGELAPHVRWFMEPIGFAMVVRESSQARNKQAPKRGQDNLQIIANQGFDAIEGVGGHVNFKTKDFEILHRSHLYAPGMPGPQRYRLAAQMMQFPNGTGLEPERFAPIDLATYLSVHWKLQDAFKFSETLVNEIVGADTFFNSFLKGLKNDPNGPQVDILADLIAHLAERATVMTDHVLPITPQSERMLLALETTNPNQVRKFLEKALKNDPDARPHKIQGEDVWEILPKEDDEDPDELKINGLPGFEGAEEEPEEKPEERLLLNSALTVIDYENQGYLLVANNIELLKKVLDVYKKKNTQTLAQAEDYIQVAKHLKELGANLDSVRMFSRTDQDFRPTYELIRQGKMPESKTMLGKILNRMLGPEEGLRDQKIDGKKLPEFQKISGYFGPGGLYGHTEPQGMTITGILLEKKANGQQAADVGVVESAEVSLKTD